MLKLAPSLTMGWILGTSLQLQQEDIWTVQRITASALFSLALLVCAWALSKLSQTKPFLWGNKPELFKGLQHLALFVCFFVRSCVHAFLCLFICSFVRVFVSLFVCWLVGGWVGLFVCVFMHA